MIHKTRSSSAEFRAVSIENWNDQIYSGLVWSIIHITRTDLEKLWQEYQMTELKQRTQSAKNAEMIVIRAIIPAISKNNNGQESVTISLSHEIKERLKWPPLEAIQFLYSQRYWIMKWWELNALLNSDEDEPFELNFEIGRNERGIIFLKKIELKKKDSRDIKWSKENTPNMSNHE